MNKEDNSVRSGSSSPYQTLCFNSNILFLILSLSSSPRLQGPRRRILVFCSSDAFIQLLKASVWSESAEAPVISSWAQSIQHGSGGVCVCDKEEIKEGKLNSSFISLRLQRLLRYGGGFSWVSCSWAPSGPPIYLPVFYTLDSFILPCVQLLAWLPFLVVTRGWRCKKGALALSRWHRTQ